MNDYRQFYYTVCVGFVCAAAIIVSLIAVTYFDLQHKRQAQVELVKYGAKPTEVACLIK